MEKQEILLESGTNEMELMTFRLGNQMFGMNVTKIQSIMQFDQKKVTHIPMAHSAMMGMMLYREKTIPLIDLAVALNMKAETEGERKIVLITEFNNTVNSFMVKEVDRIHRISWNSFVPIDLFIGSYGGNIIGSVHIDDAEILVIDIEKVLADIFPDLIIEELSEETINKAESISRENVRVFFAEDSKTIRETVVKSLNKIGYCNLRAFKNGLEAYTALAETGDKTKVNGPDGSEMPHILLTDIEMPKMDGLTLCRKVKKELGMKQIKVIMFSSLINEQMIIKCKEVGAAACVTKPEINKLAAILDKVCPQT